MYAEPDDTNEATIFLESSSGKVFIEKSRGEVSLMKQDTIENVS
jgi:hypothetical protein